MPTPTQGEHISNIIDHGKDTISDGIMEWITHLNYHYIVLFVLVAYGITHKPQFGWLRKLIPNKWVKIWLVGILIGIGYCLATDDFDGHYLSYLIHSYLVVIIFVDGLIFIPKAVNDFFAYIVMSNEVSKFIKTRMDEKTQELDDEASKSD